MEGNHGSERWRAFRAAELSVGDTAPIIEADKLCLCILHVSIYSQKEGLAHIQRIDNENDDERQLQGAVGHMEMGPALP